MKRSYINRQSGKNRKRAQEAKPVRLALVVESGRCMICGCSEKRPKHFPRELNQLCCHEIANGPLRQKALDKPYAILVLCWHCNGQEVEDKSRWPEPRQLALLLDKAPHRYDLVAYNHLVNPNAPRRIEQFEVDKFLPGGDDMGTDLQI